jgi:hypothetical protein
MSDTAYRRIEHLLNRLVEIGSKYHDPGIEMIGYVAMWPHQQVEVETIKQEIEAILAESI